MNRVPKFQRSWGVSGRQGTSIIRFFLSFFLNQSGLKKKRNAWLNVLFCSLHIHKTRHPSRERTPDVSIPSFFVGVGSSSSLRYLLITRSAFDFSWHLSPGWTFSFKVKAQGLLVIWYCLGKFWRILTASLSSLLYFFRSQPSGQTNLADENRMVWNLSPCIFPRCLNMFFSLKKGAKKQEQKDLSPQDVQLKAGSLKLKSDTWKFSEI